MKVCVCIPAQDRVHTTFMMHLLNLMIYSHNGTTRQVSITQQNGCYLDKLRNDLVKSALEMKPEYILFLDSDMTFPRDLLARLVYSKKDIIGCNYSKRIAPFHGIAMTAEDPNKRVDPLTAKGVTQVSIIPTGILLIKVDTFEKLPYPWFTSVWRASDNKLIGEDVHFCAKLGDLKIPIFCDHDLSLEIGHVGEVPFNLKMLGELQDKE